MLLVSIALWIRSSLKEYRMWEINIMTALEQTQRQQSSKRNYIWQLLTVYLGFVLFGLSENIKGPAIPRMQLSFQLDEAQIGTILSLNSLGYLIACTFTGLLVRRFGIKSTTIIAFASMLISGVLVWLSHSYTWLIGSNFYGCRN